MKILQVIPYFCFGGAETMCESLTYMLRDMGHQVSVVSLYNEHTPIAKRMEQAGIRIVYLDKKLGLDLSMIPKLAKIIGEEAPDVIHTHLDVIKYTVAAARLKGIRNCVHTVHNVADKEAEGKLQKLINGFYFRHGWSVPVALSPEVKNSIVSFYGMEPDQVPVICNGVDLSRCRSKERYASDGLHLLHVGRFDEQKNHKGLLEAFARIHEAMPESTLELIGDGELRQEMENYAKKLALTDSVRFLGSQDQVYSHFQNADVFVLPSHFEGMPMTIIEAMGTGLPIVASAVGGVPDMLTDGESGLLVSPQPEVVAQAVLRLAQNEQLRETLGQNAKQESRRFSAEYMAQCYCTVYEGGAL